MKRTLQYLQECLVKKKDKCITIVDSLGGWLNLELSSLTMSFKVLPIHINKDGGFFVVTGTRESPSGIGDKDFDMVLLANETVSAIVPISALIDIIKAERASLKIGIDDQYKKMGVWMNIGMLTSFLDDDFLSALHQPSELGSSTETPE